MENTNMDNIKICESPSELFSLLNSLDQIYHNRNFFLFEESRYYLLKAIAVQTNVICQKLTAMLDRWKMFLPFQEVIDVKFDEWAEKVQSWTLESTYVPSNDFTFDFMHKEKPVVDQQDIQKSVKDFCAKMDKELKKPTLDWKPMAISGLEEDVKKLLVLDYSISELSEMVIKLNKMLVDALWELHDFFSSELGPNQFMILSNRINHRDCTKAIREGQRKVTSEHNSWPSKAIIDHAKKMKKKVKDQLLEEPLGKELGEYIDLDYPDLFGDACFGKFLFRNRHRMKKEDAILIVKRCAMIRKLEDYIDPDGKERRKELEATRRHLDAEERIILEKLQILVQKGEWRGGVTCDSISMGINRMLGVDYELKYDDQVISNDLWNLLKKRKNCDQDRSLMVTWLNIVGYCVGKGYLSNGSPTLCKKFFPKAKEDDYKAIDKGHDRKTEKFVKITPLLDKFLR